MLGTGQATPRPFNSDAFLETVAREGTPPKHAGKSYRTFNHWGKRSDLDREIWFYTFQGKEMVTCAGLTATHRRFCCKRFEGLHLHPKEAEIGCMCGSGLFF